MTSNQHKKYIANRLFTNYLKYDNDVFLVFWRVHRFPVRIITDIGIRLENFDLIFN